MTSFKRLLILCLLILIPTVAFSETISYICDYQTYSSDDGFKRVKKKFELTFIVDVENGKGYLLGNQGSSEVTVLPTDDGISFLEVTGTGNLMTTAIDKKRKSVHSRNTIMFGELIPTQYYGKCEVK